MKHTFTFLFCCIIAQCTFAQSGNITVFTENGEKFTLLLNGEKKNDIAAASVKVNNLNGEWYQARVDFQDAQLADFSDNNFRVHYGYDVSYMIRKNKKGGFVLRFSGENPTSASATTLDGGVSDDVKRYAIADDGDVSETKTGSQKTDITQNTSGGPNTSTTTTVTSSGTSTTPGNVGMNVNVDGMTMGVNMNISGMGTTGTESTTTTTTTTTTSSTSSGGGQRPKPSPVRKPVVEEERAATGRCARSMDGQAFESAKKSISSKSFEDSKLTVAKQITKANCLTAEQILSVMGQFSFEETRLDFAKFAYDFCFNTASYYLVNDGFTFESSIDELNSYIGSK